MTEKMIRIWACSSLIRALIKASREAYRNGAQISALRIAENAEKEIQKMIDLIREN